ncbi:hypothetical protein AK812_SmicGene34291 [Symbiodinium microadriaticum]|uniref:Uncharacterized protein n=1 Tax=Symbiodinium microadriaticum TaxID=2951 RepID=A0A1Q9CPD0_SYMMI|nr:hypothetical protein AK812_SmicGene34291 [Symbiodinium microadriaticum]
MPETRAYALLEEGRRTIEESQAAPRGWHDRKWPDGEVPEKIRKQGAELVEPYALLLLLAALARRAS